MAPASTTHISLTNSPTGDPRPSAVTSRSRPEAGWTNRPRSRSRRHPSIDHRRMPGNSASNWSPSVMSSCPKQLFVSRSKSSRLSEHGVTRWDLDTGEGRPLVADRLGHSLALTPDGKELVSLTRNEVRAWDAATGKEVRRFAWSQSADAAFPRPDGKGVVLVREGRIEEGPPDGPGREWAKTARFVRPAVSPDGKLFAAAAADRPTELVVYDTQGLAPVGRLNTGQPGFGPSPENLTRVRLAFAPGGKEAATATAIGELAVWDVAAGTVTRELKPGLAGLAKGESDYTALLYSADGKVVFAATAAGTIRRWDVAGGKELAPLRAHSASVTTLLLAKDGKWLVSLCQDGMVRRWDVAAGTEVPPPDGYTGDVYAAASPDGSAAVLLDRAGRMDVWDLRTGKRRSLVRPAGSGGAADSGAAFGFLADGRRVYYADPESGPAVVWAADTGTEESKTDLGPKGQRVVLRAVAPTPDGKGFVVGRGKNRLARVTTGTGAEEWVSDELFPKGLIYSPAVSPDGKAVVFGAVDFNAPKGSRVNGRLELIRLDAGTGKVLGRTPVETRSSGSALWFDRPQFSADGKRLAVGYGGLDMSVYAAETMNLVRRHDASWAALSPDGTLVIDADPDSLAGYAADTGRKVFELPTGGRPILTVSVLPGGRRLLTAGPGGTAHLWDLPAGASDR